MEYRDKAPLLDARRIGLLAIILGIVALLLGAGSPLFTQSSGSDRLDQPQTLDPPRPVNDFSLTGPSGASVQLSDFSGSPVLLFFGYTHCPDVCPTTLAEFREIKTRLGKAGDRVTFVFISVDGSRDTPEVVRNYVAQFDPDFIGLTGDEADVRAIGEDYSLSFEHAETDASMSYLVDHTANTYLLDTEGRLRVIYPFSTPVATIVRDIEELMAT